MSHRIAVLGAGSWGTALAIHAARAGHVVTLWGRDPVFMDQMVRTRENARYLAGIPIPERVLPTAALDEALTDAQAVIAAIPSHGMRLVLKEAALFTAQETVIVSATK